MRSSKRPLPLVAVSCLLALILSSCCNKGRQTVPNSPLSDPTPTKTTISTTMKSDNEEAKPKSTGTSKTERRSLWSEQEQQEIIASIQKKFKAQQLALNETKGLLPHQFLHLHHMKTGGTSIDHMLHCAMDRLTNDFNYSISYYNIHECHRGDFRKCLESETDPCRQSMNDASVMSYCAALKHLDRFGWTQDTIRSFTVLRHPVERVWSMFRFEPRMCYECENLTQIYERIDTGNIVRFDSLCLAQLQNHEVTNLLTTDWPEDASDEEIVNQAIDNMKSFFTMIGLTEELTTTVKMLGTVFPWLNTTMEGSKTYCHLPHDNSSPENNHCVREINPAGSPKYISHHWDLPPHPDEETKQAIIAHNQLDIKLYEAAVEYFQLQVRAFEGMGEVF